MSEITLENLQIHDRVSKLEMLIETLLPQINDRFDRMEARFDRMEDRVTAMDERLSARITSLENRVEGRVSKVEGMVEKLPTALQLGALMATVIIGTMGMMLAAMQFVG